MLTFKAKKDCAPNDAEQSVTDYLQSIGVTFDCVLLGQGRRNSDNWEHDLWSAAFTANGNAENFEYSTGIGHRVMDAPSVPDFVRINPRSIATANWMKTNVKPHKPHAASVLHCLLMDSSAVGISFNEWCADFGYDTDSRKAESIYRACQESGDKLARIFTKEQRDKLAALLEDY